MDDYLAKPFKRQQLWSVLTNWIKRAAVPPFEVHSAPVTQAIDGKALDNIRALQRPGAPNLVQKIITLYLNDAPHLVQSMREAVAAEDRGALQRAAHTLKSSSANLGALQLAELCKEMEVQARADRLVDPEQWISQIEREYARVRAALSNQIAQV
jgi:HPt (histidine-containing phosphotransfer) domain-containing protein